ncbi:hypothetical protein COU56_02130 [Candidatus Pacearchaeota archaeon CG10_big_fil_rev_8_21_14_0_10_31_9]|nr:MAG: hypothetical protein AUJ62_03255 [Candidatus Pacearchaeota archaeon CG1_02_32_21]PIN95112.1 MAG: hypothetical protein COU56_02130 [Candidatus Pacearchaeota archaeon CG10_big_fil_rev_8_21_14_0_10_31_9]
MNKKSRCITFGIIISLLFLSFPLISAESNQSKIDDAYQCLKDQIDDSCSKITSEEQIYALLALGNYKDCKSKVLENSRNQECWPKSNCKLKDTALALLALDQANANTEKVENWLLNQTKVADDLVWYLQIDTANSSSCTVKYGSSSYPVSILSTRKVSSGAGSCLSVSENGYWLKFGTGNCVVNEYKISCDKEFTTTLLYRNSDSSTIHVSQNLHSESANGETTEKITYKCFQQAGTCNYEGSLWSAIALNSLKYDTGSYLPYLSASIDKNEKYFPESFLYILTGEDDYLSSILQDDFNGKFWQVGTLGKFKSTAIALLALQGQSSNEADKAMTYIVDETQGSNGCFNSNFIDTAFLLYSGWSDSGGGVTEECSLDSDCASGNECLNGVCVPIQSQNCVSQGHFCVPSASCTGIEFSELKGCLSFEICCSEDLPTCSQLGGEECGLSEQCGGDLTESYETLNCCIGTCEPSEEPEEPVYTCGVESNEVCQSNCIGEETQDRSLTCPAGQVCCVTPKSGGSLWWIWILLILIFLVILAIIFKNKLKLLFFKFRSRFKKGPAPRQTRPPFPPSPVYRPYSSQRPVFPANTPRPAPRRAGGEKNKEFEDTIRKLKEMSK